MGSPLSSTKVKLKMVQGVRGPDCDEQKKCCEHCGAQDRCLTGPTVFALVSCTRCAGFQSYPPDVAGARR